MVESRGWGLARYVTLLVVVAFHLAVLAVLLMASQTQSISFAANPPVELLFLPPPNLPKIRAENFRPKRLSGNTGISIAPPALDPDSPALASTVSEFDGTGGGVDWKAEARRAVQAFEIRTRQPPSETTLTVSPAEESWWPWTRHRTGTAFKTPSGDWIVWITSNCYQIATAAANANAPNATLPHTVCLGKSSAPGGDSNSPPGRKKPHPATN
jgi:hypothetical protein